MQSRLMHSLTSRLDPHAEVILRRVETVEVSQLRRSFVLVAVFSCLVLLSVIFFIGVTVATPFPLTQFLLYAFNPLIVLFLFACPFIFAVSAAILSSTNTRSGMTPLLLLTNIGGRAVYQGYFLATLYRLQVLVMALIAIIPIYILIQVAQLLTFDTAPNPSSFAPGQVSSTLTSILYPIRMLGISLLATSEGVGFGMSPRRQSGESAALAAAMILVYLIVFGILTSVMNVSIAVVYSFPHPGLPLIIPAVAISLIGSLILTAAPYTLVWHRVKLHRTLPHYQNTIPE
jgi:hypothetical protein